MQNDSNGKWMKTSGSKNENGSKAEVEASSAAGNKPAESSKPSEPPKDYIHVRARRGQATDSHSLAERVIHFSPLDLSITKDEASCG